MFLISKTYINSGRSNPPKKMGLILTNSNISLTSSYKLYLKKSYLAYMQLIRNEKLNLLQQNLAQKSLVSWILVAMRNSNYEF